MNNAQIRSVPDAQLAARFEDLSCAWSHDMLRPAGRREYRRIQKELGSRGYWSRVCFECGVDLTQPGAKHLPYCQGGWTPEEVAAYEKYCDEMSKPQPCPVCHAAPDTPDSGHDLEKHVHAHAYCEDCGKLYHSTTPHKRGCPNG